MIGKIEYWFLDWFDGASIDLENLPDSYDSKSPVWLDWLVDKLKTVKYYGLGDRENG